MDFYWVSINSANERRREFISNAELETFARQRGLRLPVMRDSDRTAYRALGVDALPTIVVIDREGLVHARHVGFDLKQRDAYAGVRRMLNQLMQ